MVLPPPQRLWVGVLAVTVALVELPGALPKCIFDEVQAQTGVVRAAPQRPPSVPERQGRGASSPLRHLSGKRWRNTAPPSPGSQQPIRIRSWIPRESSSLSEAEKERLDAAVEEAVRVVSSLLSVVNPVPGLLLLSRDVNKYCKFLWRNSSSPNYNKCGRANKSYRSETCVDVTIPDDHLAGCDIYTDADSPRRTELRPEGAGLPDTDFLLYVHVQATDKCRAESNVSAYAAHCQTDAHGRPVAGVVVLCRDRLTGPSYTHQAAVQTLIHEMFHALGFSKHLFHTWTDCSPTSAAGSAGCSPRGRVTHSDGSGQIRIYTPSVISVLQKHLASADPELGGPLENLDVSPGRASSHWESRVLQGSIMAAVLGDPTTVRIDPATLAAFQDTGWYAVDLSRAQSLVWGDGQGVLFGSLLTCQDRSSFFCTGSGFGCHHLHLHKGKCQTDQYLEGCGVYKPIRSGSECWKEENGRRSTRDEWSGEIFGFDSRCFFSSLTNQTQFPSPRRSVEGRCYRHRCTGQNSYQIQVSGSEWVDCPAGGTIQIKGYQGLVSCPDRRLCLYTDITPPSHDVVSSPASVTSGLRETLPSAQSETQSPPGPPAGVAVATALGIAAAVGLLSAVTVSCRGRVHPAPEDL